MTAAGVLSLFLGVQFRKAYVRSAKLWCEAQVPAVEAFRATHGRYPESLQELEPGRAIPWSVRALDTGISARRDAYHFDIWTGPLSGWAYSPSRGTWVYYD